MSLIEIKLLAILALVAGALFGFHRFEANLQAKGAAACEAAHAASDLAEEQRRIAARKEIDDESQRTAQRRMADAVGVAAAGDGLRQRAARAIGFDLSASAPVSGPPAPDATRVCAVLLEAADARLRILAAAADASRDAGKSCEASYDSLIEH